ncbi:NnrS family protein [Colwellia sp. MEBiC06753]
MLNITDVAQEQKIPAFFRLGFRPFFLSAAIFSLVALLTWIGFLVYQVDLSPYGGSYWWHGHEMIFGFVVPIIVGFLLTAVQTWTGVSGVRGIKLAVLFAIWLAARFTLLLNPDWLPQVVIAVIDWLFLPVSAFMLAWPIVKVRQWRNLFFVPVLLALALMNLLSHLAVLSVISYPVAIQHANYGAIMLITMVMIVMGGRVIPFFTANATKIPRKPALAWLELLTLVSAWLVTLMFILGVNFITSLELSVGLLAIFAGGANLLRCSRWRFFSTLSNSLLWSLHVAYLFIPISFILLGLHLAFGFLSLSTVLHGLTVGAMANLILAMIARVSLGHTGRKLEVNPAISLAFLLIAIGAIVRLVGTGFFAQYSTIIWQFTAAMWLIAFGIFCWVYWPVLTQPRVDGRPG